MSDLDYDIEIPPNLVTLVILLRTVSYFWKNAVVKYSTGKEVGISGISPMELLREKEFVLYRDSDSIQLWEKLGCVKETAITAILVCLYPDCFNITTDDSLVNRIHEIETNMRCGVGFT